MGNYFSEWLVNRNPVVFNVLKEIVPGDEMPMIKLLRCLLNALFTSQFAFLFGARSQIVFYFLVLTFFILFK